jgi:mannose-6-phosphate isomerase-like protein (cupin superfamily)
MTGEIHEFDARVGGGYQMSTRRVRALSATRRPTEVAYVLSGEVTFKIGDEVTVGGACAFIPRGVPHAWKSTGAETGRVLFLYTPARAAG